jgi:predicted restriction endonuclease
VTGSSLESLLEAAHIHPYRGAETNRVDNGLLLRADIHTVFDLGLIIVTPSHALELSQLLKSTDYAAFDGKQLRLPAAMTDRPSGKALAFHRAQAPRR